MTQQYSIIGEICKNVCKNTDLVDDLIQEVAVIWLQLEDPKRDAIMDSGSFRWWVARVVKQQWSSSSSPFYTKYRKNVHNEFEPHHSPVNEEYDTEPDEQWAHLQKHVRALFPSEFNIFNSYYKNGMTIMQITAKYDVDKNFVWATLKRVRESIQRKISWETQGWNMCELQELIAPFVGKKRLKAEERQIILDVNWILYGQPLNSIYDKEVIERVMKNLVLRLKL